MSVLRQLSTKLRGVEKREDEKNWRSDTLVNRLIRSGQFRNFVGPLHVNDACHAIQLPDQVSHGVCPWKGNGWKEGFLSELAGPF